MRNLCPERSSASSRSHTPQRRVSSLSELTSPELASERSNSSDRSNSLLVAASRGGGGALADSAFGGGDVGIGRLSVLQERETAEESSEPQSTFAPRGKSAGDAAAGDAAACEVELEVTPPPSPSY